MDLLPFPEWAERAQPSLERYQRAAERAIGEFCKRADEILGRAGGLQLLPAGFLICEYDDGWVLLRRRGDAWDRLMFSRSRSACVSALQCYRR